MENKELEILMEEMRLKVRGIEDPNNHARLFALEMDLKPASAKLAVPVHPNEIIKAFTYYLKKKGLSTEFDHRKFFQAIFLHVITKPIRMKKYKPYAKGKAMTHVKLVNPCSAIFALLKEIESVESVQE